jgi:hypothetical protein
VARRRKGVVERRLLDERVATWDATLEERVATWDATLEERVTWEAVARGATDIMSGMRKMFWRLGSEELSEKLRSVGLVGMGEMASLASHGRWRKQNEIDGGSRSVDAIVGK